MVRAQHAREPDETAFLVIVEALIERRASVSDLLQSGAGLGHVVGALRQPLESRARLLLIAILARLQPLDAQLDEIPNGLLELRPVLGLVGRELESGLQCGDPRVGESGHVRNSQPVALLEARLVIGESPTAVKIVLRISKRRTGERNERGRGDHWPQHGDPPKNSALALQ